MYYDARYYDPDLGRFLQPDPMLDGMNRYTYCGNNPIRYSDPTGFNSSDYESNNYYYTGEGNTTINVPEAYLFGEYYFFSGFTSFDSTGNDFLDKALYGGAYLGNGCIGWLNGASNIVLPWVDISLSLFGAGVGAVDEYVFDSQMDEIAITLHSAGIVPGQALGALFQGAANLGRWGKASLAAKFFASPADELLGDLSKLGPLDDGFRFLDKVDIKKWNQFQSSTKGLFNTRKAAADSWKIFKSQKGIVSGTNRSITNRNAFLTQVMESGKSPKWMNQWLKNGRVPPGYQVDHIIPLSIGGLDTPSNMRLLLTADHTIWHILYRPWQ